MTSPNFNWSPSRSLASLMDWPLSMVPLVEFKSFKKNSPFLWVILACETETEESSSAMVLPFIRPMVIISSRKM